MRIAALALISAVAAAPVLANDGFGGLSATGLTFGQTKDIAMDSEDLSIGPDKIAVDYVFRNTSDKDVSGEVIFPLPPISLMGLMNSDYNLPDDKDRPNLVNFNAVVDGKPVEVAIDRVAVIEPENSWELPAAASYDTPGRDVTADLEKLGIPLTIDAEAISAQLDAMPAEDRKNLVATGLAEDWGDNPDDPQVIPTWSIVLRYHWTQTFPAGATMRVHHDYENRPSGGIFGWEDPPEADYLQDIVKRYCVDEGTSKALAKAIAVKEDDGTSYLQGVSLNIAYVLRTANSWAGPIGKFKLTLDKGDAANVISLCGDGIKKTGPTQFTMEKTDFTPTADLDILIVKPFDFQE